MDQADSPTLTADRARALIRRELSTATRVGFTLLLLVTLLAAGLISLLWMTEPNSLPFRTQMAFGMIVVFNLCWAVLCGWVLAQRKVLFAAQQVIAGWMAVVFCAIFLLMASFIAYQRAHLAALMTVTGFGVLQMVAALMLLGRARRHRRKLLYRRDELMNELAISGST
jgi:O-antigen/teichoic acid export membrane protein